MKLIFIKNIIVRVAYRNVYITVKFFKIYFYAEPKDLKRSGKDKCKTLTTKLTTKWFFEYNRKFLNLNARSCITQHIFICLGQLNCF